MHNLNELRLRIAEVMDIRESKVKVVFWFIASMGIATAVLPMTKFQIQLDSAEARQYCL